MNDAVPEAEPGQAPAQDDGGPAAPAPLNVPRTPTGHPEIDAHVRRLADTDHLTTDGHADVYEHVHRGCATRSPRSTPGREPRLPPTPGHHPQGGPAGHPPLRTMDTGAEPNVAGVARRRLDAELVRRKLARSREHASQLIAAGRVSVGKTVATKPATQVETAAAIVVTDDAGDPDYVSRGGHKLAGALDAFVPRGLVVGGGGPWTPEPPPAASPTYCCAPGPRTWSPWTSDTDNSPGLCATMNASPSRTVRTYAS
ncbi:hypothetical protein SHKM778_66830 [Streptomyces sp. KM77-8]|uniref:RNA-binding S4 domain-containing protein n=1 Tax=Streptomyces haneummycinicus TaxID=3074435 RepID=A0AAT9HTG5_9ACTN